MTDTGNQAAAKPKRGPHGAFQPTDEQRKNVKILAALGIPQSAICAIVRDHKDRPIDEKTLRKHFRKEIETGAAELNAQIGNFMVATILGKEPASGVKPITDEKIRGSFTDLYVRSRLGWTQTVRNEIANADGKPFVYVANKTDAKL